MLTLHRGKGCSDMLTLQGGRGLVMQTLHGGRCSDIPTL